MSMFRDTERKCDIFAECSVGMVANGVLDLKQYVLLYMGGKFVF
jgi:hypothetical protein